MQGTLLLTWLWVHGHVLLSWLQLWATSYRFRQNVSSPSGQQERKSIGPAREEVHRASKRGSPSGQQERKSIGPAREEVHRASKRGSPSGQQERVIHGVTVGCYKVLTNELSFGSCLIWCCLLGTMRNVREPESVPCQWSIMVLEIIWSSR